jgi:transcriptional regulator PpsR
VRAGALDSGRDFPAAVAPADRAAFEAMMARVAAQGRAPGQLLHLGTSASRWLVRASLAADPAAVFLLQLAPIDAIQDVRREAASLEDLIERLPDGFVLVDPDGMVRRANRAFLDLVQTAALGAVIGQPLGRWLSTPGADAALLIDRAQRHQIVRGFTTTIQGELGIEAAVEISAAVDAVSEPRQIGLMLRDVSRRRMEQSAIGETHRRAAATPDARLLEALTRLTDQIGRTPLLELVRDSSGLIERHCIAGALEKAEGNRTAAAELLGMSRQSLYAKLSRYGIGGLGEDRESSG